LAQGGNQVTIMNCGRGFSRSKWAVLLPLGLILGLLIGGVSFIPSQAQGGEYQWSAPVNLSNTPDGSWFPDVVVDYRGNVHVIWCETVRPEQLGAFLLDERVYHTMWNGQEWSKPNDIVPSSPDINRSALALDQFDNLYLTYRYGVTNGIGVLFKRAPASQAWSAASWTAPRRVDSKGNAYMPDLAIDSRGVLHLVFDDRGDPQITACFGGCSDLYYRRSQDGGQTWSYPVNLSRSPVGASREQIHIDSNGTLHVTWDEGWDRVSGIGEAISGSYVFSTDGGQTWSPITSVTYPDSTVAQLTAGSDGRGGVMLVWRAASRDEIYYQWSTDSGNSWGTPATVPWILARPWVTRFDVYEMVTDSAGSIHLFVVGRTSQEVDALLGVYHLVWNGTGWSYPIRVFAMAGLYPEYPRAFVHEGNRLHLVWFTREGSMWDQEVNREVWYSSTQSPAPYQPATPVPTYTPHPPTPTPSPVPTATPYPTVSLENTGLPESFYTEGDDLVRMVMALSPILLVIVIVIVLRLSKFGKL